MENKDNLMNDEMENIVVLHDEDGNEIEFEFLDLVEYNGAEYVVLLPTDESEDDGQVIILKVEGAGEEEYYAAVEDEAVLGSVFEIFKEKFKEMFDFED